MSLECRILHFQTLNCLFRCLKPDSRFIGDGDGAILGDLDLRVGNILLEEPVRRLDVCPVANWTPVERPVIGIGSRRAGQVGIDTLEWLPDGGPIQPGRGLPQLTEDIRAIDILAEDVTFYQDEDFWGDYNYIKPDESIESVIRRMNRRLQWESLDEID